MRNFKRVIAALVMAISLMGTAHGKMHESLVNIDFTGTDPVAYVQCANSKPLCGVLVYAMDDGFSYCADIQREDLSERFQYCWDGRERQFLDTAIDYSQVHPMSVTRLPATAAGGE